MEQNENTLTVLEIVPGQYPKQVEIDPDLKSLQQAVGGNIGVRSKKTRSPALSKKTQGMTRTPPMEFWCTPPYQRQKSPESR